MRCRSSTRHQLPGAPEDRVLLGLEDRGIDVERLGRVAARASGVVWVIGCECTDRIAGVTVKERWSALPSALLLAGCVPTQPTPSRGIAWLGVGCVGTQPASSRAAPRADHRSLTVTPAILSVHSQPMTQTTPLARAVTLPSRYYIDPSILEAEKGRIFGRTWQLVARYEDLQRIGDFVPVTVLDEPVVVTHAQDGKLHAYYNVCRHRAGQVALTRGNRSRSSADTTAGPTASTAPSARARRWRRRRTSARRTSA